MILIYAAALLLVILIGARIVFQYVFGVPRADTLMPELLPAGENYGSYKTAMCDLIRRANAIPYETVQTRSHDGLNLSARLYRTDPQAPVQILVHGYRSMGIRDFSGGLSLALESGCNALLIDQRAHGHSDGSFLSFGILEREDVLAWTDFAIEQFGSDVKIVLVGISMGAATVLMVSELALPENVVGIIADSGYTSPKEIICRVMANRHIPVWAGYPFVRLGARLFGGFDPGAVSAPEALKKCRIPVLFIHGEGDHFVPCQMTLENYAACAAPKYLLTVPDAPHGISFILDEDAYRKAVGDFLKEVL